MSQPVEDPPRGTPARTTEALDDAPATDARRRRWSALAGAAAGVLVVAVAAAAMVGLAPEPAPPGGQVTVDCPPPSGGPDVELSTSREAWPDLPDGAVAARACVGGGPGFPGEKDERLAAITLHSDIDRLVSALNGLRPYPGGEPVACTSDMGILYDLVLAYPSGERIVVRVETFGCGRVQVGDRLRAGGWQFRDMLRDLAEKQRWADAPATPPSPTCPAPSTLTRPVGSETGTRPLFDAFVEGSRPVPYQAVAVAVCRYSSTDPATADLVTSTVVTGDGAERARALVNQQGPEVPFWSCEPPAGSFDVLVFTDKAGGGYEIRLGRGDCTLFYSYANLSSEPDPELRRWLDDTLGGPPPG